MTKILLLVGFVLFICVALSKLLYKFGIPTLTIFLTLGMLLGSEGIGGIHFDDPLAAQQISTIGLIFIMFYGGFGVSWRAAKKVALPSVLLSTIGVVLTALLTGIFTHYILKISLLEGLLIGAVVSSTDAASVFSILRSKKLYLKNQMDLLLEIESGSNDPTAYMLTIIVLSLLSNQGETSILSMLLLQIVFGFGVGFILAKLTIWVLHHIELEIDGLYPILIIAVVVLGFAISDHFGGNGFLSVYVLGIVLGNSKLRHKRSLLHFFDGISWLMQIVLFFTLGLLVFPSQLPGVFFAGLVISLFMIFVARPISVVSILCWFKIPIKHQMFISWVGLRGAASIVFATFALSHNLPISNQVFNTVFFIALFSIIIQGSFIPTFAKRLDLVETDKTLFKRFSDYQDEVHAKLTEFEIKSDSPLAGKSIMEANIPEQILVVMIKRQNAIVTPKGSTQILPGDVLVLIADYFDDFADITNVQ